MNLTKYKFHFTLITQSSVPFSFNRITPTPWCSVSGTQSNPARICHMQMSHNLFKFNSSINFHNQIQSYVPALFKFSRLGHSIEEEESMCMHTCALNVMLLCGWWRPRLSTDFFFFLTFFSSSNKIVELYASPPPRCFIQFGIQPFSGLAATQG